MSLSTDPIADMLSRIRNAIAASKPEVSVPYSKIKESIANILKETNFIDGVKVEDATVGRIIKIAINNPNQNPRITEIARISSPGRRQYSSATEIPNVMQGRGEIIISTSKGIMTGAQARAKKVGGELICKVY